MARKLSITLAVLVSVFVSITCFAEKEKIPIKKKQLSTEESAKIVFSNTWTENPDYLNAVMSEVIYANKSIKSGDKITLLDQINKARYSAQNNAGILWDNLSPSAQNVSMIAVKLSCESTSKTLTMRMAEMDIRLKVTDQYLKEKLPEPKEDKEPLLDPPDEEKAKNPKKEN